MYNHTQRLPHRTGLYSMIELMELPVIHTTTGSAVLVPMVCPGMCRYLTLVSHPEYVEIMVTQE